MLNWLKKLFQPPEPSGPPQTIRLFSTADATISRDGITIEGDTWTVQSTDGRQARLFEVEHTISEKCMLTYRAKMKARGVTNRAYLEMWCRLPGTGEFFSKGFDQAVSGDTDWASVETPFFLKEGQEPDLIKLNVVIEGPGTVHVKDVKLLMTPLK
jgi:hypothetical protein